jgi:hypothetical protein
MVLGWHAHPVYDAELIQQVSKSVTSAVDSIKLLQENWESFTGQFTEGKLIIRNLTDTTKADAPMVTLTVIADSRLNISFASVAIRVATNKLKAVLGKGLPSPMVLGSPADVTEPVSRVAPAPNLPSLGPGVGSSLVGGSSGNIPLGRSSPTTVASTGLSWSGLSGSSGMSGSGVSVVDSASSDFLTVCTKALARKVGPMSKILVKEAVIKVCPDGPFSLDNGRDLITELAKHIRNPAESQQFRMIVEKAL